MNICHVITRLIVGGAQENTLLTCRGLAGRGHRVTLVAGSETGPEGSLWDQTVDAGYQTVRLDSLRRAVHPRHDLRALRDLRRLFDELKPDVVHTHSSKAGILGRRAAAEARVPTIIHTIHGMSFNRTQSVLTRAAYRFLERRAARYTSALVAVADAMVDQAVAARIAPRDRFTTIRSGMDLTAYVPDPLIRDEVRASWGFDDGAFVIGTVARLFDHKGYDEIIAAMPAIVRAIPACRFVWMGDGAKRGVYERSLNALGLRDRVHLMGLVRPEDVPRWIAGFDVLVHASRWEGLPRSVVQALLLEVPAVSFACDGAPEVVIPDETGYLVPLGDVDGLARAVVTIASDSSVRRIMGQRGRARCLAMFDWHNMVEQLEALYDRLAGETSHR